MKFANVTCACLLLLVSKSLSLIHSTRKLCKPLGLMMNAISPDNEAAKSMTEYLAKSHEEKLKNEKLLREREAQILKLTRELEALKGGALTTTAVTVAPPSMNEEDAKITAYQTFIANYIVKAQEEKLRAVKAAEVAMEKKYKERLLVLTAAADIKDSPAPAAPQISDSQLLYFQRVQNLKDAAAVGKSRWGAAEIEKISKLNTGAITTKEIRQESSVSVAPATSATGGLTLADRLKLGANNVPAVQLSTVSIATAEKSLYDKRNARVVESGEKSRWGEAEISKLKNLPISAEVKSTSETWITNTNRVNIGAAIANGLHLGEKGEQAGNQPIVSSAAGQSLYDMRNANIVESASAGKSRWGEAEINKLKSLPIVAKGDSASADLNTKQSNVGASLADRIKLGASLEVLSAISPEANPLYEARSAKIVEMAGSSRWGEAEINKLKSSPPRSQLQPFSAAEILNTNRVNIGAMMLLSSWLFVIIGLSQSWFS